jgi:hypothetical protein
MVLAADSTTTAESPDDPADCRLTGTWTVSGTEFRATGRDCFGVPVTNVAPTGSTRMTGLWTAGTGASGTFTVTEQ